MSADKEPFVCYVPRKLQVEGDDTNVRNYQGPTPYELLEPLFANKVCRYKVRRKSQKDHIGFLRSHSAQRLADSPGISFYLSWIPTGPTSSATVGLSDNTMRIPLLRRSQSWNSTLGSLMPTLGSVTVSLVARTESKVVDKHRMTMGSGSH